MTTLVLHPQNPTLGQKQQLAVLREILPTAEFRIVRNVLRDVIGTIWQRRRPATCVAVGVRAARHGALLKPKTLVCVVPAAVDLSDAAAGRYSVGRAIKAYLSIASVVKCEFVCQTAGSQRTLVKFGINPNAVRLVRPGVDSAAVRQALGRTEQLRERLGIAAGFRVIHAPGETTHAANHGLSVWAASVLAELHSNYRLVLAGEGPLAPSVRGFISRMLKPSVVLLAADYSEQKDAADLPALQSTNVAPQRLTSYDLAALSDVALFTPRAPIEPFAVACAMASGKPIVATLTPGMCEYLEDRHTCLMAAKMTPRVITRRLLDLHEDPTLAWQIADRARAEAYDLHSLSGERQAWRDLFTATAVQGAK